MWCFNYIIYNILFVLYFLLFTNICLIRIRINDHYYSYDENGLVIDKITFNKEKYKIPYRMYAIFEYDLQKSIKFKIRLNK